MTYNTPEEMADAIRLKLDDEFGSEQIPDMDGKNPLPFNEYRNYASLRRVIGYWVHEAWEAGRASARNNQPHA